MGDAPRRNRARDDEEGKGNSRPFHPPYRRDVVRPKLEPRPPAVDGEDKKETETGRQAAVTDEGGLEPRPKDGNVRSIVRCRAMEGEYGREKRSVETMIPAQHTAPLTRISAARVVGATDSNRVVSGVTKRENFAPSTTRTPASTAKKAEPASQKNVNGSNASLPILKYSAGPVPNP